MACLAACVSRRAADTAVVVDSPVLSQAQSSQLPAQRIGSLVTESQAHPNVLRLIQAHALPIGHTLDAALGNLSAAGGAEQRPTPLHQGRHTAVTEEMPAGKHLQTRNTSFVGSLSNSRRSPDLQQMRCWSLQWVRCQPETGQDKGSSCRLFL